VGVVGAADEVEASLFDERNIAVSASLGNGVSPSGMILVDVGSFEVVVLAVEEEALVRGKFKPAKSEGCREFVGEAEAACLIINIADGTIEKWVVRMP
jgi:hypothetical protein